MSNKEQQDQNKAPGKILVVDDNVANIDIILTLLEAEGYSVSIATSGKMALKIAQHKSPDLILLDVMMPDMDGFETCKRLKEDKSTSDIPVIFVTAKKEVEDVIQGFNAGGVDYISKPFRREEVLARVNSHVQLKQLSSAQQDLIQQLHTALEEVKTLRGLLPICSYCKKIKNDAGDWQQLETYLKKHTDVDFSHGICSDCYQNVLDDINED